MQFAKYIACIILFNPHIVIDFSKVPIILMRK